jgi:Fe/S biogenesis protein NfuA
MDDLAPLLVVTAAARERILEIRAREPEPDALALWLEISGVKHAAYTYDMYFQRLDEAGPDDNAQRHDEMSVVVPRASIDKVRGATLDLSGTGMVVRNPNSPSPAVGTGRPPAVPSGDVAERVVQVLDEQINPAIAAHGGRAELVAVEDGIAYLRLGGGCQGCGMATVTLSQGIEVAILDAVPELAGVVDVTDHASGTNPFFESAKG